MKTIDCQVGDPKTYARDTGEAWSAREETFEFDYDGFEWRCVELPVSVFTTHPLRDLGKAWSRSQWVRFFTDEAETYREEMGGDYYEQLEKSWVEDPLEVGPLVVAVFDDGSIDIGDGWHRAAISVKAGLSTVPAVVGTSKRIETNPRSKLADFQQKLDRLSHRERKRWIERYQELRKTMKVVEAVDTVEREMSDPKHKHKNRGGAPRSLKNRLMR